MSIVDVALSDALAGWRYIRAHHGDLYGVGWDRVETRLAQAIEARMAETTGSVHESAVGETDASDQALLADICDNMAEVLKPLPGIPDAPGDERHV